MRVQTDTLAKKYAQALLNLYSDQINTLCFQNLERLKDFFKKNREIAIYFNISSIPDHIKEDALEQILQKLKIDDTVCKLARALFKQRRIELFGEVAMHISREHKKRNNIETFKIFSSHILNETQQDAVLSFLKKSVHATVQAEFFTDSSLICGIKILGDNVVWERSFAQRLNQVMRSVLHRTGL